MNKARILSAALVAAMVSTAAVVAVSAEEEAAAAPLNKSELDGHSVGLVGSFNNWSDAGKIKDIVMNDDDHDYIWEGKIEIDNVTEDMIQELYYDKTPSGKKGITFKVRLDNSWASSWGQYEPDADRTFNSQTNCFIENPEIGKPLTISVKFDANRPSDEAVAAAKELDVEIEETDYGKYYPVIYEVVKSEEKKAERKTEESKKEETPASTPAVEEKKEETPATGDATSAAALVGVVLASLGAAVVMTKKSRE